MFIHLQSKEKDLKRRDYLNIWFDSIKRVLGEYGVEISISPHRKNSSDFVIKENGKYKKVIGTWKCRAYRKGWISYGVGIIFQPNYEAMDGAFRMDTEKMKSRPWAKNIRDVVGGLNTDTKKLDKTLVPKQIAKELAKEFNAELIEGEFSEKEKNEINRISAFLKTDDWIKNAIRPKELEYGKALRATPANFVKIPGKKYKLNVSSKFDNDEVEIGSSDPHIKLSRWGDECFLKISKDIGIHSGAIEEENKIKWRGDKQDVHIYAIGEDKFEFEIILKEEPETNILKFKLEAQRLNFFYQPELSREEKERGSFGPENVVGSYAVYHESKEGNYSRVGGKNYRAGKAFHIYRPRIKDAVGNEVWGELNIDIKGGFLTVTIPQEFLDNAVYPIYQAAGFTFGYEDAGLLTDSDNAADFIIGSVFTSPGDTGTVDRISAYIEHDLDIKAVIYTHSDSGKITNGESIVDTSGTGGPEWVDLTFSTAPSIAASTAYVLTIAGDGDTKAANQQLHYDAGDTNQGHFESITYPTTPATASFTHNNNKYSVHCDYSGAPPSTVVKDVIGIGVVPFAR